MKRARGLLLAGACFAMVVGAEGGVLSPLRVAAAPLQDVTPAVSSVTPSAGPTAGGTSIVIDGTGFTDTTDVLIGSTDLQPCGTAPCFTFVSDSEIDATTAPASAGTDDVIIVNPSFQSSPNPPDDSFTYLDQPTVTNVPNTASEGATAITVTGSGFSIPGPPATSAVSEVDLVPTFTGPTVALTGQCSSAGAPDCFGFTNDTHMPIDLPSSNILPGQYDTVVITPGGSSNTSTSDQFVVQQDPPTVTSVTPDSGPQSGGPPAVTVGGSNFSGSGFSTTGVSFGGNPASFTVSNSTTIHATPPAGSGLVDVTVTTASTDGTSVQTSGTAPPDTYVYAPLPTVTNVAPNSGSTGGHNQVVVTGSAFESSNGPSADYSATDVFVDTTDISASPCPGTPTSPCFTINSATKITVQDMPAHAAGVIDITVQTEGGTSNTSSADQYTYQQTPGVSGVSPPTGPIAGGNNVDVTGSNFTGATDVFVGSVDLSPCPSAPCFVFNSSTSITIDQMPSHGAGTVDITVETPAGTSATNSADEYTYVPPVPTVTGVAPGDGPAGGSNSVTVTGTGFEGTGYAATDVFVGTIDISNQCPGSLCFTINSATSITIPNMPAHAAGTVDVTVENSGGTSATSPADQYEYEPTPVVTSVFPSAGALGGGNTVTVGGSGFSGATDVTIGGDDISATPCPGSPVSPCFNVTSATQISVEDIPSHSAATVDITVTTSFGVSQTSSADTYTYAPVPTVTALSPQEGQPNGTNVVGVTGTGFESGSNFTTTFVSVGSVVITATPCGGSPGAPCFTVNSATSITIEDMPSGSGQVNVTVTTPGGTSLETSQNVYTYSASGPVVSELSPVDGAVGGGEAVSLFGSGFGQQGQDFVTHVLFSDGPSGPTTDVPSSNSYPCPSSPNGCFTVVGPTQLAIYTPQHAAGTVYVQVETPVSTSGQLTAIEYTFIPPGAYTAVTPYRVCDTRPPVGGISHNECNTGVGTNHTLSAKTSVTAQITTAGGPVPLGAQAVVVNVTAIDRSSSTPTYVTAYPAGGTVPFASNINLAGGKVESNLAIVQLSAGGAISLYNAAGVADVIVDVQGYFAAPVGGSKAGEFHSMPPLRRCDTRYATTCVGSTTGPLLGGKWRDVVLSGLPTGAPSGTPSIPANNTAAAAVFNLTGTAGSVGTFLAVAPAGAGHACPTGQPPFSNLNPSAGIALPNRVISLLGPNQDVCIYNALGSINFIIDVNGWFGSATASAGALFYSVPPTRICDTRSGNSTECANSPLIAPKPAPIDVAGVVAVPAWTVNEPPLAVVANLTAVAGSAATFFSLYPSDDSPRPSASDLNPSAGEVIANLAITSLSQTAQSGLYAQGYVDLYNAVGEINAILDVAGWFQ
jgi:hypothetical protein